MEELSTEQIEGYVDLGVEKAMDWGPQLLLAILVLIVGLWLINRMVSLIGKGLDARSVEKTLGGFLTSFVSIILKILLVISVASMIGIETTSFIAVLGAAGLAVGLALQGSLANFAGGILILFFRPFRVGDFIEAQGVSGTVFDIQIFNTIMRTPDNKRVIVPNGAISNDVITNYSAEPTRRVDFVFGIGYGDDIDKAKQIIEERIKGDERVLAEPAYQIVVSALADSSVNITVRAWVDATNYWPMFFETTEAVKKAFDQNGISIPFPQRDIHVHNVA